MILLIEEEFFNKVVAEVAFIAFLEVAMNFARLEDENWNRR